MSWTRSDLIGATFAAALTGLASAVAAQEPNFTRPEAHFKVQEPANLAMADALTVYNRVLDQIADAYAVSRDPSAKAYRNWRRYNQGPYRSATHGDRYVNNYANATADPYDTMGPVEMPVGSILAKDSFAVTASGDVFPGPLFLMEKMPQGFRPEARDWRYTMILPDGSFFGVTNGDNSERVDFCITCHQTAGDDDDHLFFVPEDYRSVRFD